MLRTALFVLSALAIFIASYFLFQKEKVKRSYKADFIELSRAQYGLFNVDHWRSHVIEILRKKVDELEVDASTEEEARKQVSSFLYKVIDDFERDYKAANERKSYFGISIKNLGADFFELFDGIRAQVPGITEGIINYLKDPNNKEKLKSYLASKVNQYASETFAAVDYSSFDEIIAKHGREGQEKTIQYLQMKMQEFDNSTRTAKWFIYLPAVISFLLLISSKSFRTLDFVAVGLSCLVVLAFGLWLPMIDIDARISQFAFTVMGEPITFSDQVVYYKSKSILEVVDLMLSQTTWDIVAVGILVFLFSVLLPATKLIVFFLSMINHKVRNGGFSRFLLERTGKWSMADVLVVAIFMSYIGFSSILSEQLSQLERTAINLRVLTTNNSELNTGFFLFFTYVLLSIALSEASKRSRLK